MERLTFLGKDGDMMELYVVEQTRIAGVNYLLAADSEDGDGECLILKDISAAQDLESVYEIVEDEGELNGVLAVFEQLLDDVEIQK